MEQTFSRPASSLHHNDLASEQICAQEVRIGARNTRRSLHECKSTQIRTVLQVQPKYFGSRILDCARGSPTGVCSAADRIPASDGLLRGKGNITQPC